MQTRAAALCWQCWSSFFLGLISGCIDWPICRVVQRSQRERSAFLWPGRSPLLHYNPHGISDPSPFKATQTSLLTSRRVWLSDLASFWLDWLSVMSCDHKTRCEWLAVTSWCHILITLGRSGGRRSERAARIVLQPVPVIWTRPRNESGPQRQSELSEHHLLAASTRPPLFSSARSRATTAWCVYRPYLYATLKQHLGQWEFIKF